MTLPNLHDNAHAAYEEAGRIDAILNDRLKEMPIHKQTVKYWETLLRTIQTSIDLIETEINRVRYL